jgi:hypothetical protein
MIPRDPTAVRREVLKFVNRLWQNAAKRLDLVASFRSYCIATGTNDFPGFHALTAGPRNMRRDMDRVVSQEVL